MTWKDCMNLPIVIYQEGMFFGEFEVYRNIPRIFNCVATTQVECLILKKKEFKRIFFKNFPELGRYFVNEMSSNLYHLKYTMESLQEFLEIKSKENLKLTQVNHEMNFLSKILKIINNESHSSKINQKK